MNFLRSLYLQEKKNLMTALVSMLFKSRLSLTCFRACFIPGRAKDLSAPRYIWHFIEKSGILHALGHTQTLKVIECAEVFFSFLFVLDVSGLLLATAVLKVRVFGCYALQRNKELLSIRKRILPPFLVSDNPNKGF